MSSRRDVVGPQWEREGERLQSLLLEREELAAAYYGLPANTPPGRWERSFCDPFPVLCVEITGKIHVPRIV